jgi:cystathionine gamma-synthase
MADDLKPETVLAQAGGALDAETGAIIPPIHVATTFLRDPDNQYRRGYGYARPDNATVRQTEAVLANLERGAACLLFGSGMAAATAFFLALPRPAHVVAPEVMYWALRNWLIEDASSHGISVTIADASSPASIAAAVRPGETRAVWIETPANPLWTITDIAAAAEIAHRAGAVLAVDSTVATPLLTRPLTLGADVVMHSATKYLNGHSDVVAGALVFAKSDRLLESAAGVRKNLGGILGPFEAALLMRGLRTLHVRVPAQCASALAIAQHFSSHPAVEKVFYPGLPAHAGHETATRQMSGGFSGMLSIRVKGGEAAAVAAAARVAVWKRATSLGGVESLIEHRASVEGPGSPCPRDLLRLSAGLEATSDLIADLEQALAG